jgi:hypothetical protein
MRPIDRALNPIFVTAHLGILGLSSLGCRLLAPAKRTRFRHSCCREQGADAPSGCYSVLGPQKDQSIASINFGALCSAARNA